MRLVPVQCLIRPPDGIGVFQSAYGH